MELRQPSNETRVCVGSSAPTNEARRFVESFVVNLLLVAAAPHGLERAPSSAGGRNQATPLCSPSGFLDPLACWTVE